MARLKKHSLIRMRALLLVLGIPLGAVAQTKAQNIWAFEILSGAIASVPTPLRIRQLGEEDIRLMAKYEMRPLAPPFYYVLRIARRKSNRAWELELIHLKLYLKNGPAEVQFFAISHGYNHLSINWAQRRKGLVLRLGAGIVFAHPENKVRGKKLPENGGIFGLGQYLSGPGLQAAIGKELYFWKSLSITAEGKITLSFARIPIQDGRANMANLTFHGIIGLRYSL